MDVNSLGGSYVWLAGNSCILYQLSASQIAGFLFSLFVVLVTFNSANERWAEFAPSHLCYRPVSGLARCAVLDDVVRPYISFTERARKFYTKRYIGFATHDEVVVVVQPTPRGRACQLLHLDAFTIPVPDQLGGQD